MALEQHPVPQNISSYQFRLVGDMTLKQFFQIAAGAGIGLLIYGSPLPGILKWPLIIFFVIMGAAFAFLPVQDRPLSQWLMSFFRSIYSPTIFTWQRNSQLTQYFVPEDSEALALSEQPESMVEKTADIQAQFGEVASSFLENLEGAEEKYLSKITGLFHHSSAPVSTPQQAPHATIVNNVAAPVPSVPPLQPTVPPAVLNQPITPVSTLPFQSEQFHQQQTTVAPTQTLYQSAPPVVAPSPAQQTTAVNEIFTQITQGTQTAPVSSPPAPVAQTRQEILFNVESPTQPNILVGKVRDKEQNPISSAILEIKDEFGRPVRALKTDNEGKFRIVTPLSDGKYSVITEKDGFVFEPIHLDMQNTIVEPLFIEPK